MPVLDDQTANLSILRGRCSAEPVLRVLDSGTRLATLSLRVPADAERTTSVPVTIWDPASWVAELAEGDELVVVGHVRRRFFRTATGGAAARVEVVADSIVRAGERRRVVTAARRAHRELDELASSSGRRLDQPPL